ncbi:hypothetical protein [Bacillus thuringiensis]|uniref:hypothetical protein n=1 Tax=Bacillus thuringiensis TaxID=1428 RepID=UPI000BF42873|nr:hypothetical protein [Bacillus thuringiensis]PEV30833.1 hypothetical protein CN420_07440 [Bacillus thuringiensis]
MESLLEGFYMSLWTIAFASFLVLTLYCYGTKQKAGIKFREYMDVMGSLLTSGGGTITVIISVVQNKGALLIYVGLIGLYVGAFNSFKKMMDMYDKVSTVKEEEEEKGL